MAIKNIIENPTSRIADLPVSSADSPAVDSFGRWRISNPITTFESYFHHSVDTIKWESIISGTGSVTHIPNSSTARLSTGSGNSGAYIYRQSRRYHHYEPGKSLLIVLTFVLENAKQNVRKRIGYFDSNNGIFLQQTSEDLRLVRRTGVTGSADDSDFVTQNNWNLDPLNGSGKSGINLSVNKSQILIIDLQWLGVGRVRCGFSFNGNIVYCHEFINANRLTTVYMSTGNLPTRLKIENTGAASGETTLDQICSTVVSEGGYLDVLGTHFSANRQVSEVAVTTRRAVLSIRPKATLNSIIVRGLIIPDELSISPRLNSCLYEIVYNPTFSGTPTWSSADDNSIVEYSTHGDAAAGAVSGGIVSESGYAIAGTGSLREVTKDFVQSSYPIVLDSAGLNPAALSIVCTSVTAASNILASMDWHESH